MKQPMDPTRPGNPGQAGLAIGLLTMALLSLRATCFRPALPVEFLITTTDDFPDENPGDGECAGGPRGRCSLRAAIEELDHDRTLGIARLPAGDYDLDGEIRYSGPIDLFGAGADVTVIRQTRPASRVLRIEVEDGLEARIIHGVTIRGGRVVRTSSDRIGGGIKFTAPPGSGSWLTLQHCRVTDNEAFSQGGGIAADGNLAVRNCIIDNNLNEGGNGGAGIYASVGSFRLERSEIRDNRGDLGAAIRISGGLGFEILQSTIAGNRSNAAGSGLTVFGASGSITSSTFAGNNGGPALHVITAPRAGRPDVELSNVTIAGNNSDGTIGIRAIALDRDARLVLLNTVVAFNPAFLPTQCSGTIESSGGNFLGAIGAASSARCTFRSGALDHVGPEDPGLGRLTDNGGSTRTLMPLPTSLLRDAGTEPCPRFDQTGRPAPVGGGCDIGAVELQ